MLDGSFSQRNLSVLIESIKRDERLFLIATRLIDVYMFLWTRLANVAHAPGMRTSAAANPAPVSDGWFVLVDIGRSNLVSAQADAGSDEVGDEDSTEYPKRREHVEPCDDRTEQGNAECYDEHTERKRISIAHKTATTHVLDAALLPSELVHEPEEDYVHDEIDSHFQAPPISIAFARTFLSLSDYIIM